MHDQAAVAVVGCGYWGKNLVRNFHQLGDCASSATSIGPACFGCSRNIRMSPFAIPMKNCSGARMSMESSLRRPRCNITALRNVRSRWARTFSWKNHFLFGWKMPGN